MSMPHVPAPPGDGCAVSLARTSTSRGAIGAFGFSIAAEITRVLATGTNWVAVPPSLRLTIEGRLKPGSTRVISVSICTPHRHRCLDFDLDYRCWSSPATSAFSLAARTALCSSPTEMRACGVFFPPSEAILAHANAAREAQVTPVYAMPTGLREGSEARRHAVEPQIVRPAAGSVQWTFREGGGRAHPDHAFIGSCGSGMYETSKRLRLHATSAANTRRSRRAPGDRRVRRHAGWLRSGAEKSAKVKKLKGQTKLVCSSRF